MTTPTLDDILFTELGDVTATAAEIEAWGTLDDVLKFVVGTTTQINTVVTKVGLFGFDLTDFLAACTDATDVCDPADYAAFTGWAVGVNWSSSATVDDGFVDGVIFATSLESVQVAWDASGNTASAGVVDEVAVDLPDDATLVDVESTLNPFEAWGALPTDSESSQFAFSFFENDTDFYFEAGDLETIWTTCGSVVAFDNVENVDFELVGAASLTAATSVIVAALLF
jgi:hypothetical protein